VKRVKRILRRFLLSLSLVLLLASLAAWIRSYFVCDQLVWTSKTPVTLAMSYEKGRIDFVRGTFEPSVFVETKGPRAVEKPKAGWEVIHVNPYESHAWQVAPPEHEMHLLGAKYRSGNILFAYIQNISLPLWMLVVVFGVWPTVWLVQQRRRRRSGYCQGCGYDIRATPQRCPECGREVTIGGVR
jgi:hypothetical protein